LKYFNSLVNPVRSKLLADYPSQVIPWKIPFEKGVLKAIAKTKGVVLATYQLKTAGQATKLVAKAGKLWLKADKQDVSHIYVIIADENDVWNFVTEGIETYIIDGPVRLVGMEDANSKNA
jgi:beta-galactosidase